MFIHHYFITISFSLPSLVSPVTARPTSREFNLTIAILGPMDDLIDISQIMGNASDDIKRIVGNPGFAFQSIVPVEDLRLKPGSSMTFGGSIVKSLKVVEISLNRNEEEEKKMEARVVVELDVTEGQCIIVKFILPCLSRLR